MVGPFDRASARLRMKYFEPQTLFVAFQRRVCVCVRSSTRVFFFLPRFLKVRTFLLYDFFQSLMIKKLYFIYCMKLVY